MLPSTYPTILHGRALEYYYMNCQNRNLSVDNLITRFKEYFEGAQHRRHRLFEWNNINLRNILHQNPDHDKGKLFIEVVENFRKLQQGLDQEHRTDGAMYNRVVSACRTTPQFIFAILQQAFTLPALIDNIYAALQNSDEIEKLEKTEPINSNTYFTDRKYHRLTNQGST
ncbi:putative glycosyl transferase [Golovinomyces cichoracearum]|uniref:Putative glycosyl transferase n=1 Tax=Golovinomyces cichoracearum TaxID=62708 RepID=A0A420HIW0_9PEZI|nr:putative glycosyl transferase [Golovinomyces cichoracearum]